MHGAHEIVEGGIEPTRDLHAKYVAYWTESNKSMREHHPDAPNITILGFDDFVMSWGKFDKTSQIEMAEWYETGFEESHRRAYAQAENKRHEYETDPACRERVRQECEELLARVRSGG